MVSTSLIAPMNISVPIVDPETGNPTPYFQQLLQKIAISGALKVTNGVLGLGTGSVTTLEIADGTIVTIDVANNAITYAKMQNVSATKLLLGRNSALAGVVEEVTLSQLLDWIGTTARGDVLFRGASTWSRLPAGTAGQVLTTQGTGADPTWTTPASGGGGGVAGTPAVRASVLTSFNAATVTQTFPTGTIAGDVVLIYVGHAYQILLPTGWTSLQATNQGNYNGAVFVKIMTAGDITTGSVTVTQGGSYNGTIVLVTLTGSTVVSLTTSHVLGTSSAGVASSAITHPGVKTNNLLIGFAATRAISTNTILYAGVAGTTLQSVSATESSVMVSSIPAISDKITGAAGETGVASFSVTGNGYFFSLIGVT